MSDYYDPTVSLLSTNALLQTRTGNPIFDTMVVLVMTTFLAYVTQCKTALMPWLKKRDIKGSQAAYH